MLRLVVVVMVVQGQIKIMADKIEYETYIEPYTCSWHREHPDTNFSGCSCTSGVWMCRKGTGYQNKNVVDALEILDEN